MQIIIRALPLNRDSRVSKYKLFFSKENENKDILINTWEDFYEKREGLEKLKFGRKQIPLFLSYPLYLLYLFLFSLIKIKKGYIVICIDLDVFIPVWLGSFWKKTKIYFDIVDPAAETKFRKLPFNKIFDFIEYFLLKNRKYNILPADYRVLYYYEKLKLRKVPRELNYLVVENVPIFNYEVNVKFWPIKENEIRIGYFGVLEPERGLIELIDFIKNYEDLKLYIAGSGSLETYIKNNTIQNKIIFLGHYAPEKLPELYSLIDYTWAYYSPKNNLLHYKYACPNKYYEHLYFKKPIIINKYVYISNKIEEMNTGVVIPDNIKENFDAIYNKLKNYRHSQKNFQVWDELYKDYKYKIYQKLTGV